MTQFATNAEFAARMGLTLTAAEQTRADTLLALASDLIVEATGQDITEATDDVYTAPSVYGERLRLPQRPVASVSQVQMTPRGGSAATVDPNSYYLDGGELVRTRFPLGYELTFGQYGQGWLGPFWTIAVTYTHGYSTIPGVVKAVCMEAVRRVWVNTGSVVSEHEGETDANYGAAAAAGLLLTAAEQDQLLDVLIGYQAGSIALR